MTVATQTVREIALEQPSSIRVFERHGIDYCCGGRKPLEEACSAASVQVDALIAELEAAAKAPTSTLEDWSKTSLGDLCAHIVSAHHTYVRNELPRLGLLAQKVVNRHGSTRAEVLAIQARLSQLDTELTYHLAKEELVLFPYVSALERATQTRNEKPHSCFGTVANPIAMMVQEHDGAGELLAEIRSLSNAFTPPEGACPTYLAFYDGLKEFERDLHQHIHLENNILFPGAIKLEASAR